MGWIKGSAGLVWSGAKGAVKLTAATANGVRKIAVDNQASIAAAGKGVISVTGKTVQVAGRATKGAADLTARAATRYADSANGALARGLGRSAGAAAKGVGWMGWGVDATGRLVDRSSRSVGDAIAGAVTGTVSLTSEALDSVAIGKSDLQEMRAEIKRIGELELQRSNELASRIEAAREDRRKSEMLDLYIIGGVSLAEMLRAPYRIPDDVIQAYELAYPGLAANESFADAVGRLPPEDLPGLVAGIKGKLFELQFVDYLNDGNLPDSVSASLAESSTQRGWDIQIVDQQGQVLELLQAKATNSAAYVREALERYPGIDVVTTQEVYAQLTALGLAEQVRGSGINEAALQQLLDQAAGTATTGVDFSDVLPSAIGLAVVGLSVFMDKSVTAEERARIIGERSGRVGVSSMAAKGLMVVTQTWWLGLIGGVGSHWLSSRGRAKRERYDALKDVLRRLRHRERHLLLSYG